MRALQPPRADALTSLHFIAEALTSLHFIAEAMHAGLNPDLADIVVYHGLVCRPVYWGLANEYRANKRQGLYDVVETEEEEAEEEEEGGEEEESDDEDDDEEGEEEVDQGGEGDNDGEGAELRGRGGWQRTPHKEACSACSEWALPGCNLQAAR